MTQTFQKTERPTDSRCGRRITAKHMDNPAQDVRDAIDLIDETPFGQIGKLFDRMSDNAQRAVNDRNYLIEVLEGMVLVCGRTGDSLYDFEEQAATFYDETGCMRPGKDMPAAGSGEDDREARRTKYNAWVQTKIESGRAAVAATKGGAS